MADDKHTKGSMECPYPETPFESLKEALLEGVNHMVFCYQERAVANLVAAAWRDEKWEDVLVICEGKRSARKFIEYLSQNLSCMHLDGETLVHSEENITLSGNRKVLSTSKTTTMRGTNAKCFIFLDVPPSPDYLPALDFPGVEMFTVAMTKSEEYLLSPITKNLDT